MRMTAFRVQNYRCIDDSGWVETGPMTAIVGRNESGKTSLLRALQKFNPPIDDLFDLAREWPRSRRKEASEESPVVTVKFEFSPDEYTQLKDIEETLRAVTGVIIEKNYRGDLNFTFLPEIGEPVRDLKWMFNVIKEQVAKSPQVAYDRLRSGTGNMLQNFMKDADNPPKPSKNLEDLRLSLQRTVQSISKKTPMRIAVELVNSWIPTIMLMDECKVFSGTAQLDQLFNRQQAGKCSSEDSTLIKIMEMSGLNLENEVKKINHPDRESRMLDLNDAASALTLEIAHRWSQKKYEIVFSADGSHFITFVRDVATGLLIPLEERSKGFQWFFSFDMNLMYETRGELRNAIILLDEPGLHLHSAAQKDLQKRLREYADRNQLIYTTHLPFMLDTDSLDSVCIADEGSIGVQIRKYEHGQRGDAAAALQAIFALNWISSLICNGKILLVLGQTEAVLLPAISHCLHKNGRPGLSSNTTIVPAGDGILNALNVAVMHGDGVNIAALVDNHYKKTDGIITISELLNNNSTVTIEDLIPEEIYIKAAMTHYSISINGDITLDKSLPMVQRISEYLNNLGVSDFDRTAVATAVAAELYSVPTLSEGTLHHLSRLIARIEEEID
jgi:energy-coupling factor transporter ATP-binding protein EcfA2